MLPPLSTLSIYCVLVDAFTSKRTLAVVDQEFASQQPTALERVWRMRDTLEVGCQRAVRDDRKPNGARIRISETLALLVADWAPYTNFKHINGDPLDIRRANLATCSAEERAEARKGYEPGSKCVEIERYGDFLATFKAHPELYSEGVKAQSKRKSLLSDHQVRIFLEMVLGDDMLLSSSLPALCDVVMSEFGVEMYSAQVYRILTGASQKQHGFDYDRLRRERPSRKEAAIRLNLSLRERDRLPRRQFLPVVPKTETQGT